MSNVKHTHESRRRRLVDSEDPFVRLKMAGQSETIGYSYNPGLIFNNRRYRSPVTRRGKPKRQFRGIPTNCIALTPKVIMPLATQPDQTIDTARAPQLRL